MAKKILSKSNRLIFAAFLLFWGQLVTTKANHIY